MDGCRDHAWIEICTGNNKSLLCGCIYRTQSNDLECDGCIESTRCITKLIKTAYHQNKSILIAGDFNYKEIDWEREYAPHTDTHLIDFIETLQECFLYQHVSEPTRNREGDRSNLLDLILSSEEGMVRNLTYHPPLGESDHVILRFNVPFDRSEKVNGWIAKPDVFKTNYEVLKEEMLRYDWDEILTSNFQEAYDSFFEILQTALEKHSPMQTPPHKRKNIYMNKEAIRLKNAKRRLWKRYLSTKTKYDNDQYKLYKNRLRAMTRDLRHGFEHTLALNIKKKPKSFWRYAKSRLKTKQCIPPLVRRDGTKASTAQEIAYTLNDFFVSVFTKENKTSIPVPQNRRIGESLVTILFTPDMVRQKLKNLNPGKSPGHDKWHPHFLRELANDICIPLSILFNKSLKEKAHRSWLKAIITSIYKKGIRNDPGNYRPVSLTSVIAKVMESLVRDAILSHLIQHDVLSDCQHGFVPGRDCITQLLLCLEDWTLMLENNKSFDVIYTDFAKAFNSIPQERVLNKLENLGVRGDILNWIRSFLTGRTQCVRVEGFTSKWMEVVSGIPQGSVLGPLLFVVFINDLPNDMKYSICRMFADDCKLYGLVGNENLNKLQIDLCELERWSLKWQLPFNVKKCKVLHFGKNNPEHEYVLYDHILETSDQQKDLGILVDNKLKFHSHAAAASKKVNQVLGVIKKVLHHT